MQLILPETFETGLATVDAEHRRLIDLINEALPALLHQGAAVELACMLDRLRTHAEAHFATEEALLVQYRIDARHTDLHRASNRGFLQLLDAVARQIDAAPLPAGLGRTFLVMLVEWLCLHVFDIDQRMAEQVRLVEGGSTPAAAYAENQQRDRPLSVLGYLLETLTSLFAESDKLRNLLPGTQHPPPAGAIDPLTGLPTRSHFFDALQQAMVLAGGRGEALAVLQLDIDGMREINQSLGMGFTDGLLVEIARRLSEHSRRDDLVARIGNGEFIAAFLGGGDRQALLDAAQRFYQQVSSGLMASVREEGFALSAGLAFWPGDGAGAPELLVAVEAALEDAQREGGGCLRQHDPTTWQPGSGRAQMISELRHALKNNELVLHYQPQLSLYSGAIVGVEALVRWQHPGRGLMPPGHFIPLAEEVGLVVPLGEWVLAAALEQSRRWQDAGLPQLRMAVNISARHFRQIELAERVEQLLAATGVAPQLLELELTESVMASDPLAVIRVVDRLKSCGVRLSLDDFGTGYSSLAYLARFAIDTLKIDQSFVSDITRNPANAMIVQATIAMAHKLGKSVIAEGVETQEQLHYLRKHDCDEMQGYLFSRPVPAAAIETLLREGRMLESLQTEEAERPCLLLVDDEPNVLSALKRLLRREGYRILVAQGGAQGLDILAANRVEVILSDQRMPEMTGSEFLSRVKVLYPDTVRMVLSGYSELAAVTDAVNRGAIYKFLYKPWVDEVLKTEIRAAFRHQKERTAVPGQS